MSEKIAFKCACCGAAFEVPAKYLGGEITCSGCGLVQVVPANEPKIAAAPQAETRPEVPEAPPKKGPQIAGAIRSATSPSVPQAPYGKGFVQEDRKPLGHQEIRTAWQTPSPVVLFLSVFGAIVLGGAVLFLLWNRRGVLEGEVYIATKGGQNFKLGQVLVQLHDMATFKPYLQQKMQESAAKAAELGPLYKAAYDDEREKEKALHENHRADPDAFYVWRQASDARWKAQHELEKILSGDFYFEEMPRALVGTLTNADGKFTIEVPSQGAFAITAKAQRSVGDKIEKYFWVLPCSMDGATRKAIMLSNHNLTSAGSPDSLISTKD